MNISLPGSFTILGTNYKVKLVKKIDNEGSLGICDPDKRLIKIRKDLLVEDMEATFLHELTHAILFTLGYNELSEDERFVEQISQAIYQVIKTSK